MDRSRKAAHSGTLVLWLVKGEDEEPTHTPSDKLRKMNYPEFEVPSQSTPTWVGGGNHLSSLICSVPAVELWSGGSVAAVLM